MINILNKMINIKNLTVKYSNPPTELTAVKDICFSMDKGEICAVLGPSGCGKSTLLHVLSGILRSYSGEALIEGKPVNPKLQRIGLVPQNFGLLEWNTVYDNAVLGLRLKNGNLTEHQEHISNIIKRLGIDEIRDRYPSNLSGGQRQRVSIARSFIMQPHILLMDEPFSALDAITREDTQELFMDIWKSNRVTTLFVTHSIEEALFVGQKIIIFTPAPGKISRVIENPVFGMEGLRLKREFYDIAIDIRKIVKEDWQND